MGIVRSLSVLALRQVAQGVAPVVGVAGIGSVAHLLGKHFTDHSQRLALALRTANERAWQALEVALAGESLWGKLDDASDRAFRQQVRAFLDATPLAGLPAHGPEFRQQALRELRSARKAGLIAPTALAADELADGAVALTRFKGADLLEEQWRTLEALAEPLRQAGHSALAHLVSLRPSEGEPLLVVAVRYFFRRAVESDEELFRGLALARWESLAEGQQRGFDQLADALNEHGRRLEEVLDVLTEVRAAVLDLRREIAGQREQIQRLADDVLRVLGQHRLERRELRPGDSLSLRTDEERRLVRDLVTRYRGLPEDQRRRLPALLNAVGKMEVVVGNFESARRDFADVAGLAASHADRAEAHFNSYQAALECRSWDEALAAFREAVALDPERFTPFPLGKYEPERILGAGGFGVAFLCRDRHSGGRVVIKALRADGLDRPVSEVFAEARVLEEVEHPAIIRLRYCDYAGASNTRPYLVMDYFEAPTLADHIAQHGPLPPAEAMALMRTVAEALQAAHGKNIFHRDVKPANLLVRREASEPGAPRWQMKLIDFGLALKANVMQATMAASHAHTQTLVGSSVAGTLEYAAPEQLGKLPGVAVGPYSDVYGLGKTACFALFGTTLPLPKHWRSLSQEVADLLGQCLAEDPKERPAGCAELLLRLPADGRAPAPEPAPVAGVAPVAVPVASVAPAVPDDPGAVFFREMQPWIRAVIAGIFGLLGGVVAGAAYFRVAPGASVGLAFLMILVGSGMVCGLGAAIGRNWSAHPPATRRPVGPVLAIILGLAFVGPLILWETCVNQAAYQPNPLGNFYLWAVVGILLEASLSFVCGWKLENTLGPLVLGGLMAALGVFTRTPAFGILTGLVCAAAAAASAAWWRAVDEPVDGFIGSLLERLGGRRMGTEAATQAAEAPEKPLSTMGKVGSAVGLGLPVLVGAFVGGAAGMNSGARAMGLSPRQIEEVYPWLLVAGPAAGGFAALLWRLRVSLAGAVWLAAGALLGLGSAALVVVVGWWWLKTPTSLVVALAVWGGFLGALWGLPSRRALPGALLGMLLMGAVAALGTHFAHADPATLAGVVIGATAGTLVWRGLKPKQRWLSRLGVAGVAAATCAVLLWFRADLAAPARVFSAPNTVYSSQSLPPAFSPEGNHLLTLTPNQFQLWDVLPGTLRKQWQVPSGTRAVGLAFGSDGSPLFIGLANGQVTKWNAETGETLGTYPKDAPLGVSLAALSPAGDKVVCLDPSSRSIRVIDLDNGSVASWSAENLPPVTALALSPSGRRVLFGCRDGKVRLWELTSGEKATKLAREVHVSLNQQGTVTRVGFSPSGRRAFSITGNGRPEALVVWGVEGWRDFREPGREQPGEVATCAAISPDDRFLLWGTTSGGIHLWDLDVGRKSRSYRQHQSVLLRLATGPIQQVAFAPNGVHVLSWATNDQGLRFWSLRD